MHRRFGVLWLACGLLIGATTSAALHPTVAKAVARPAAPAVSQMRVSPTSGPAGTTLRVEGQGISPFGVCQFDRVIHIDFTDAAGTTTQVQEIPFAIQYRTRATIPIDAIPGSGTMSAFVNRNSGPLRCHPYSAGSAAFSVTP
jgi:hypothetical protein